MAYIQSSGGAPIPREQILDMARAVGLSIPEEDLEALSTGLRDQLDSIGEIETLDLRGVAPSVRFDARWHD